MPDGKGVALIIMSITTLLIIIGGINMSINVYEKISANQETQLKKVITELTEACQNVAANFSGTACQTKLT